LMYQPTGYSIGNRLGSEQDFINMVNTCRNASVDVIVDVVLNHFTYVDRSDSKGFGGSDRPFTSVAFRQNFPDANYNASHFHDSICNRNIVDFNSYDEWWNCRLVTLVDLKTEDPFVRRSISGFLNRMIAIGVAGFRVDVAVCVPPADWTAIYSQLNPIYNGNKAYISQEVFKVNGNYNEYPKLGRTINFEYGKQVGQAFRNLNGKTIDTLDSIFQSTGLTDRESTVIIENHDKVCNLGIND
jgi:alpha-amylase